MNHAAPHPAAYTTVTLAKSVETNLDTLPEGSLFQVEDYWDRITGGSWMNAEGNPAALVYAVRSAIAGLPTDNEVVYGKAHGLGVLVHVSELGEPPAAPAED